MTTCNPHEYHLRLAMAPIDQLIQSALEHHRAGDLPAAEAIYRQILSSHPSHAPALHLLGVIAYQSGETADAIELISRAIAINPNVASFHSNLGNIFRD